MGFNLMDEAASHARAEQNVAALAATGSAVAATRAEQEETARQVYEAMIKDNRSWGVTLPDPIHPSVRA